MKPDSNRLVSIDASVIVIISTAICLAAHNLLFMSIFVPFVIAARMLLLYALRNTEQLHFRVEVAFLGICTLLGAYNDYSSVCIKGIYDYTVPHFFSWSTIPFWMLLYWGMILRMFARFARWEALAPPDSPFNALGFGRWQFNNPALKIGFMLALIFITRNQIYRHYLHPTWSWVPFLMALLVYLAVCKPTRHDFTMMAIVLPVGPLVEMLYINVGGLHQYHLGVAGGVPIWIILWWLLIILIWKDIALRVETSLKILLVDKNYRNIIKGNPMDTQAKTNLVRSVLITGASTGIGEACALHLAARGWLVFAGVRRKEDGQALVRKSEGTIIPLLLDVTKQEQINSAVEIIQESVGDTGLDGLFNNAGIAVGGPLEYLPMDQVEYQFRVNVFGAIAVTQACMPLIRKAQGRILFTSSNSGFWCEPFLNVYGGSKHALEAIGDSLRFELQPWDIHVALIEPGMVSTPIWDKAKADFGKANTVYPPEALKRYEAPIAAMQKIVNEKPAIVASPYRVARAVQHALEARHPKTRYQVGIDCRIQYYLRRIMPDRMRDWLARNVMGL